MSGKETPRPAVRYVCILAVARTGSSYLTDLLGQCPGLNEKSELFHRRWVGRLSKADMTALQKKSAGAIRDDSTLCEWRAAHVGQTLNVLYRSGGAVPVLFKLFPEHLTRERISRAIFARDDVVYIVLRRRPIESFISSVKAVKAGKYRLVDTTEIKPVISAWRFLKWSARVRDWYAWIDAEIRQRDLPHVELIFERDLEHATGEEVLSTVLGALESLGLAVPWPAKIEASERQDKEARYQDRVANWAEFEAILHANPERAAVLQWAQATP